MERKIGTGVIRVEQGDITQYRVDAIVNAANTHLWMGGGVAGAIKRDGGEEIERDAVAKGPIRKGDAVVTVAGRLPCRYVIHAATMAQDLVTDAETIRRATRSSLQRADELGLSSIALPALGTGVGGFSLKEAAQLMLGETAAHLKRPSGLRSVIFVLRDEEAERAFVQALERVIGD